MDALQHFFPPHSLCQFNPEDYASYQVNLINVRLVKFIAFMIHFKRVYQIVFLENDVVSKNSHNRDYSNKNKINLSGIKLYSGTI